VSIGDAAGPEKDLVQIGASQESRDVLDTLKDAGHIADFMDGYRLGIALAVGFGRKPNLAARGERKTMFAVGNLDPDNAIREAIREIYPQARAMPSRAAEDLAEQGLSIAGEKYLQGEDFSFAEIVTAVEKANELAIESATKD
jgi:hypothetical protein